MTLRPKPSFSSLAFGHTFGVLGAVMGLNAIATLIDPHYLALFPFADTGIEQTSAALVSVGLFALAGWLVCGPSRRRAKAKIEPRDPGSNNS